VEDPVSDQPEWALYNLARAYQSILNLADADSANLDDCFVLVGALSDIDIELGSSGRAASPYVELNEYLLYKLDDYDDKVVMNDSQRRSMAKFRNMVVEFIDQHMPDGEPNSR